MLANPSQTDRVFRDSCHFYCHGPQASDGEGPHKQDHDDPSEGSIAAVIGSGICPELWTNCKRSQSQLVQSLHHRFCARVCVWGVGGLVLDI